MKDFQCIFCHEHHTFEDVLHIKLLDLWYFLEVTPTGIIFVCPQCCAASYEKLNSSNEDERNRYLRVADPLLGPTHKNFYGSLYKCPHFQVSSVEDEFNVLCNNV